MAETDGKAVTVVEKENGGGDEDKPSWDPFADLEDEEKTTIPDIGK